MQKSMLYVQLPSNTRQSKLLACTLLILQKHSNMSKCPMLECFIFAIGSRGTCCCLHLAAFCHFDRTHKKMEEIKEGGTTGQFLLGHCQCEAIVA